MDHQEEAQGKNRINFSSSSKYCSVAFLLGPMGKQVPSKKFPTFKTISMFSIKADVRGQRSVTESAEMLQSKVITAAEPPMKKMAFLSS